jgi:peptide deformylase
MAVRRVLHFENLNDRKTLKTRCRPIKLPDDKLKRLVDDMFETMQENSGLGLAAPQIGLLIRLLVIRLPAEVEKQEDGTEVEVAPPKDFVMINPRIVKMSTEEIISFEGCLSLPGWFGDVPRASWVTIEYQDLNGKVHRLRKVDGLLGRAIQHEYDHLEGVFFTERIRDLSTLRDYREEQEGEALLEKQPIAAKKPTEHAPIAASADDDAAKQPKQVRRTRPAKSAKQISSSKQDRAGDSSKPAPQETKTEQDEDLEKAAA